MRHLRLVHDADRRPRHDEEVFRIEQEILGVLEETKHRELVATASRLVAERLAPVDPRAARLLLDEIRRGDLP